MSVPETLRREVSERAQGRCEYCRFHEADFFLAFQLDHVRASQHGGPTLVANLALACAHCNSHKGTNLSSFDPDSNERAWLFDPRRDRWEDHFTMDGPHIRGLSPTGRATVVLLQFNAEERGRLRQRLQGEGRSFA